MPSIEKPRILIEISVGELFDRVTILEIKLRKTQDALIKNDLLSQLEHLRSIINEHNFTSPELEQLVNMLVGCNQSLWLLEDKIRVLQRRGEFQDEFVSTAQAISEQNDLRFALKRQINYLFGSPVAEYKIYS